jgi:hypothetical protein
LLNPIIEGIPDGDELRRTRGVHCLGRGARSASTAADQSDADRIVTKRVSRIRSLQWASRHENRGILHEFAP